MAASIASVLARLAPAAPQQSAPANAPKHKSAAARVAAALAERHWVRTVADFANLPPDVRARCAQDAQLPAAAEAAILREYSEGKGDGPVTIDSVQKPKMNKKRKRQARLKQQQQLQQQEQPLPGKVRQQSKKEVKEKKQSASSSSPSIGNSTTTTAAAAVAAADSAVVDASSGRKRQRKRGRRGGGGGGLDSTISPSPTALSTTATGDGDDHHGPSSARSAFSSTAFSSKRVAALARQFEATRHKPFCHAVLENVFDEAVLADVMTELADLEFVRKSNDLYDFWQTRLDLRAVDTPAVARLRSALYSPELRSTLQMATGIQGLTGEPDMFCARYVDGSTLLAHDDDESDRRIAYILYLVPPDWEVATDGGALALMQSDADDQPTSVAAVVEPKWNSLAFFEVNARSWHQVSEVTTAARERMSISGWWHGPVPPSITKERAKARARAAAHEHTVYEASFKPVGSIRPVADPRSLGLEIVDESSDDDAADDADDGGIVDSAGKKAAGSSKGGVKLNQKKKKNARTQKHPTKSPVPAVVDTSILLEQWVNPLYLKPSTQESILEHFSAEQSVLLGGFLTEDKYAALMDVIDQHQWELYGPAHRRHYQRVVLNNNARNKGRRGRSNGSPASASSPASAAIAAAGSRKRRVQRPVAELLQLLLSSEFAELVSRFTGISVDRVSHQLRRFSQGTYTLAQDAEVDEEALDCVLCCPTSEEIPIEHGGQMVYMDEDSELLSAPANANTLVLCKRDPGTMKFVKYLNHQAKHVRFDFALVYRGDFEHSTSDSSSKESSSSD